MAAPAEMTGQALPALLKDGALAGNWTLDTSRSAIGLRSKSMWGLAPVKGVFREVSGTGTVSPGGEAPRQPFQNGVYREESDRRHGNACWHRHPSPQRDKGVPMGNWQLDPYHTQVEFSAKHFGMMTVRGHFAEVTTTADIDPEHPESSAVQATIKTASIRSNNEMRDNDVRSPNFLDTDTYPVITFKSSGVQPAGPDQYTLTGDLTIKDTTRPVSLTVTRYGEFNDPGMMGHRISYGARGQINRTDFGVGTNMVLDGKLVVSNEIQILIEGELVEQAEAAEATTG